MLDMVEQGEQSPATLAAPRLKKMLDPTALGIRKNSKMESATAQSPKVKF